MIKMTILDAMMTSTSSTGLIRVPQVLRSLGNQFSIRDLVRSLMELARDGAVELRPESAIGRLSAEDRAASPIGIDGTPLTYARILG